MSRTTRAQEMIEELVPDIELLQNVASEFIEKERDKIEADITFLNSLLEQEFGEAFTGNDSVDAVLDALFPDDSSIL